MPLQYVHVCFHRVDDYQCLSLRAGGNGMAGTAMAVPVFEEERMALLGF